MLVYTFLTLMLYYFTLLSTLCYDFFPFSLFLCQYLMLDVDRLHFPNIPLLKCEWVSPPVLCNIPYEHYHYFLLSTQLTIILYSTIMAVLLRPDIIGTVLSNITRIWNYFENGSLSLFSDLFLKIVIYLISTSYSQRTAIPELLFTNLWFWKEYYFHIFRK